MNRIFYTLILFFLFARLAQAQDQGISFQAMIKNPQNLPVSASNVTVNMKVLSHNGCILRDEDKTGVDITDGYLNVVIGKGATTFQDPGFTFQEIMNNDKSFSNLDCVDADNNIVSSNQTYAAAAGHTRKLRLSFLAEGQTIIADFNMRSTAFAINSETLNGKKDSDFLQPSATVTQNIIDSFFSSLSGGTLSTNISGSAASAGNVTGTVAIANGGTGATTVAAARTNLGLTSLATMATTGTADNTTFLRGDGQWTAVSAGGGSVNTVSSANGDIIVSQASPDPELTLNSGTGANQIVKLDGSSRLPAVDGSQLTGIQIMIDDITSANGKYWDYRPNGAACADDQILKYDSSTGWICTDASTGSVTSITKAATVGNPLVVSGTASDPTLDLPVASNTTSGYLSSTDWSTFNNKQSANSELSAIGGLATTGILQRTGANTFATLGTTAPVNITAGNIGVLYGTGLSVNGSNQLVPDFATTNTAGKVVQANDARLPAATCNAGNLMRWNGSAWVCEAVSSLPDQSGESGKFLTTNGTSASWGTPTATPAGNSGEIQFNSSNTMSGSSSLTFDSSNTTLTVGGQVRTAFTSHSSLNTNWRWGNIQRTTVAAGTLTFTTGSMADGNSYTLILTSAGTFTLGTGDITTWKCLPACPSSQITASGHTVLTIIKAGTTGYVSWLAGFL